MRVVRPERRPQRALSQTDGLREEVDVVNRGGDADTNAATTGALLGALYGQDAIPDAWVNAVLEAPATVASRGNPEESLYHPCHLLALAPE